MNDISRFANSLTKPRVSFANTRDKSASSITRLELKRGSVSLGPMTVGSIGLKLFVEPDKGIAVSTGILGMSSPHRKIQFMASCASQIILAGCISVQASMLDSANSSRSCNMMKYSLSKTCGRVVQGPPRSLLQSSSESSESSSEASGAHSVSMRINPKPCPPIRATASLIVKAPVSIALLNSSWAAIMRPFLVGTPALMSSSSFGLNKGSSGDDGRSSPVSWSSISTEFFGKRSSSTSF